MSLHDFLTVLRKRWVWVLVPVLVLGGLVTALSMRATPVYRATASMYVALSAGNTASDLNQGSTFTQSQMTSFARLATLPIVTGPVVEKLGLSVPPKQFAHSVSAATPQGTSILSVSVTSADPQRAAAGANAVAAQLVKVVESLAPTGTDGRSTIQATVVDEATPPSYPIAPNTKRNVIGAVFAGLVLGLLLAFLREALDTRVRRPEDVAAAIDVPIVGSVRSLRRVQDASPLAMAPGGGQSEDFRRVRTNLQMIGKVGRFKSFVISSAIAAEGKTHVSVRVAAAFAAAGDRTLLIDADLRRPAVADELGLEGSVGLTECLVGRSSLAEVVQPLGDRLTVLASGAIPPNASELLSSREFEDLLEAVRADYDTVVIDAPPLLPVSDGVLISRLTTGLILVVDASRTRRAQVRRAVESVRVGGGRVSGVVLNKVKGGSEESYAYVHDDKRRRRRRSRARGHVVPGPSPQPPTSRSRRKKEAPDVPVGAPESVAPLWPAALAAPEVAAKASSEPAAAAPVAARRDEGATGEPRAAAAVPAERPAEARDAADAAPAVGGREVVSSGAPSPDAPVRLPSAVSAPVDPHGTPARVAAPASAAESTDRSDAAGPAGPAGPPSDRRDGVPTASGAADLVSGQRDGAPGSGGTVEPAPDRTDAPRPADADAVRPAATELAGADPAAPVQR
ncbi:polysaccharide biosynthesis tyrosine autokinase [Cellulomonas alba]|uniref:Polysaccharide biosynthesis tyrosine autokinase n=1 Tax=Cellulomonas alba TaxID=3053467 RepID=A0ABT7SJ44_9CELL|nr:polysaccharide biosynthesis tyrosine autokinase [Cellulomonas alba]MDM7855584.1 polysaccharide biosynthesis tyrosine autokinase [Cellulomonas alba]